MHCIITSFLYFCLLKVKWKKQRCHGSSLSRLRCGRNDTSLLSSKVSHPLLCFSTFPLCSLVSNLLWMMATESVLWSGTRCLWLMVSASILILVDGVYLVIMVEISEKDTVLLKLVRFSRTKKNPWSVFHYDNTLMLCIDEQLAERLLYRDCFLWSMTDQCERSDTDNEKLRPALLHLQKLKTWSQWHLQMRCQTFTC